MQSHNYVPGVSGWKLHPKGDFEINSSGKSSSAAPQMITVVAAEWRDEELPSNAIERYAFIGSEIAKIPAEYRGSAEFSSEQDVYGDTLFDSRTILIYKRLETAEEASTRHMHGGHPATSTQLERGVLTVRVNGVIRLQIGTLE